MKKFLKIAGLLLLVLICVVLARTLFIPSRQIGPIPHTPERIDSRKMARDLAGAIPFQTISWEGGGTEAQAKTTQEAFVGFHAFLEKTFPLVYAKLDHEVIGA